MTVRETPDVAGVSLVKILCLLPYRPDIFPEPLRVVIEIDDSAGGGIVAAAGVRKIEFGHGFFYQLLDASVFLLVVEGAVLKYQILGFGDVHHLHLWRDFPGVIGGEADAVAFYPREAPITEAAAGVADVGHHLATAAVGLAAAVVVQLALDAVQQAADGLAVLSRNLALFLPEVPIPVALIIPDV